MSSSMDVTLPLIASEFASSLDLRLCSPPQPLEKRYLASHWESCAEETPGDQGDREQLYSITAFSARYLAVFRKRDIPAAQRSFLPAFVTAHNNKRLRAMRNRKMYLRSVSRRSSTVHLFSIYYVQECNTLPKLPPIDTDNL